MKFAISLKLSLLLIVSIIFFVYKQNFTDECDLRFMNAIISVFVICVEMTIYLLLYNLQYCAFNCFKKAGFSIQSQLSSS